MEKTLKKIEGGLTESGNLTRALRDQLRESTVKNLLPDFESTPSGAYVYPLVEADGKVVYAKINLAITVSETLFDAPKAKEKVEEAPAIDIGDIFE